MTRPTYTALLTLGVLFVASVNCGESMLDSEGGDSELRVEEVGPQTLLPGSRLRVHGGEFRRDDTLTLRFDGTVDGRSVSFSRRGVFEATDIVSTKVDDGFLDGVGTTSGSFSGSIIVEAVRGDRTLRGSREVELDFAESLEPDVEDVQPTTAAFMDRIAVEGSGFLQAEEGRTVVKLQGTFESADGQTEQTEDLVVPLEPGTRDRAWYVQTPEIFGLRSGTFTGTFAVENWYDRSSDQTAGNSISVELDIPTPRVDTVNPDKISRGQRLRVLGVGFIPRKPDERQRSTLILEGTFTHTDGRTSEYRDATAIALGSALEEPGVLQHVLRPSVNAEDELEGLGSEPGILEGEIRVRMKRGEQTLTTPPRSFRLKILPTKQVVYLKYLPGFSESLRKYGLRNVEQQIRDRVLEVCERDYEPYHVSCRTERPEDWADYTVIEIGGRDPNDGSLFGLDNTEGVDRGNHRLDEVIGGRRATDESGDNFSYGGVFVESFLVFSPTLTDSIPIESERFDDIFGPFIPDLGGEPVQVDEYPSGPRAEKISRAIRVLGNLTGNTTVHEVGHALGLANTGVPDQVHHQGIKENLIMNRGVDRSFARRAEIDGTDPAIWGKRDSRYLEGILPKP